MATPPGGPAQNGLRVLIVDFYDSYTWNLVDLVHCLTGSPPACVQHDRLPFFHHQHHVEDPDNDIFTSRCSAPAAAAAAFLEAFDAVILSPGPGHPSEYLFPGNRKTTKAEDDGTHFPTPVVLLLEAAEAENVPVFGVCLGLQILCLRHGIPVEKVAPAHGLVDPIVLRQETTAKKGSFAPTPPNEIQQLFDQTRNKDTINVVRYHSLAAKVSDAEAAGSCSFDVLATTSDGELLMAAKVKQHPHYGVQFHPESILTDCGASTVANFLNLAQELRRFSTSKDRPRRRCVSCDYSREPDPQLDHLQKASSGRTSAAAPRLYVQKEALPRDFDVEDFFERVTARPGGSTSSTWPRFWLDNARAGERCRNTADPTGRSSIRQHDAQTVSTSGGCYSYLGGGRLAETVQELQLRGEHEPAREEYHARYFREVVDRDCERSHDEPPLLGGRVQITTKDGVTGALTQQEIVLPCAVGPGAANKGAGAAAAGTFLSWFSDYTSDRGDLLSPDEIVVVNEETSEQGNEDGSSDWMNEHTVAELPFDFRCGFVGYFGYGLRGETLPTCSYGAEQTTRQSENENGSASVYAFPPSSTSPAPSAFPDAYWCYVSTCVVLDHGENEIYLLSLDRPLAKGTLKRMLKMNLTVDEDGHGAGDDVVQDVAEALIEPVLSREEYISAVDRCKQHLHAGDSYELCLTTLWKHIERTTQSRSTRFKAADAFPLYRVLRRKNPAPYGCYVEVPGGEVEDGYRYILSSSPERFLKIDVDGWAEMKPIKGTARRDHEDACNDERLKTWLGTDAKNKAENLMIVDLVRNDLAHVCEPGTVHCPYLMHVESYQTVHQLVSTVRGKLKRVGASKKTWCRPCRSTSEEASFPAVVTNTRTETSSTLTVDTCSTASSPRVEQLPTAAAADDIDDARPQHDVFSAVAATFPPGSMTGAPKKRSCELLEESLETVCERGPYSGGLGFLGLGHTCELSVVIRSLFLAPAPSRSNIEKENKDKEEDDQDLSLTLHTGGAITVLSDACDEYDEMLLKGNVLNSVVREYLAGRRNDARAVPRLVSVDTQPRAGRGGTIAAESGYCSTTSSRHSEAEAGTSPRHSHTTDSNEIFTTLLFRSSCAEGDEGTGVLGGSQIFFLADHWGRLRKTAKQLFGWSALPPEICTPPKLLQAVRRKVSSSATSSSLSSSSPRLSDFFFRVRVSVDQLSKRVAIESVRLAAAPPCFGAAIDAVKANDAHHQLMVELETESDEELLLRTMWHQIVAGVGGGTTGGRAVQGSCSTPAPAPPLLVKLDSVPTNTDRHLVYYKTSKSREIYDAAMRRAAAKQLADENERVVEAETKKYGSVLLHNTRGEVTELTFANVAVRVEANRMSEHVDASGAKNKMKSYEWVTPPLRSGLLPGILRLKLLKYGLLRERVITVGDLGKMIRGGDPSSVKIVGFNAVRGVFPVELDMD